MQEFSSTVLPTSSPYSPESGAIKHALTFAKCFIGGYDTITFL